MGRRWVCKHYFANRACSSDWVAVQLCSVPSLPHPCRSAPARRAPPSCSPHRWRACPTRGQSLPCSAARRGGQQGREGVPARPFACAVLRCASNAAAAPPPCPPRPHSLDMLIQQLGRQVGVVPAAGAAIAIAVAEVGVGVFRIGCRLGRRRRIRRHLLRGREGRDGRRAGRGGGTRRRQVHGPALAAVELETRGCRRPIAPGCAAARRRPRPARAAPAPTSTRSSAPAARRWGIRKGLFERGVNVGHEACFQACIPPLSCSTAAHLLRRQLLQPAGQLVAQQRVPGRLPVHFVCRQGSTVVSAVETGKWHPCMQDNSHAAV